MMFLLSCTIRASVILATGLLISSRLKSASAALRYFVLAVSTICAALVPVLMLLVPAHQIVVWRQIESGLKPAPAIQELKPVSLAPPLPVTAPEVSRELEPSIPPSPSADVPHPSTTETHSAVAQLPEETPRSRAPLLAASPNIWRIDAASMLMTVWLAGVFYGLAGLIGGGLHLRRLLRPELRLAEHTRWGQIASEVSAVYRLRRRVQLFECRTGAHLATWGVFRPKVLLPAGAQGWSDDRIRVVIHHELAHIQRGDWWTLLLAEIQRAVCWFNPLYWMMCDHLVRNSEQACDDVALRHGIVGAEYAEHLLELARVLNTSHQVSSTALSMSRESTLEKRFGAILNPATSRKKVSGLVALATLGVFACLALPLTSFRAAASALPTLEVKEIVPLLPTREIGEPPASPIVAALTGMTAQAQSQPGRANSIRGIVTRFGTSEPVPAASVELRRIECGEGGTPAEVYTALTNLPNPYWTQGGAPLTPPQILKTTTADDGRFAFENLQPGSYCIVAFRGGGYLAAEYLQRSYRGPGSTITLAEGQQYSNINLALIPTGSISGRITDAKGEPMAHAIVLPLEPVMYEGRRRLNVAMSTVQTNDLGEYRLYWLTPGRYYVAAIPEDSERRTVRCCTFPSGRLGREELLTSPIMKYRELEDGTTLEETFAYVYYGSGTDPNKALPVEVKPGTNTAGIDIPLTTGRQRSWRVRGTVTNGVTGQPAPNVSVRLMPREWTPNPVVPTTLSDAAGAFDIPGVIPGSYFLYATGSSGQRGAPRGNDSIPVPELIARVPVAVSAADVNGVKVVINAGSNLAGRVSIEGAAAAESAASLSQMRVRPLRDPDIFGQPAALTRDPVPSAADGSFTLTGIGPGDYRVFVEPFIIPPRIVPPPPPPGPLQLMYVKAIRLGNQDILTQGLHIDGPPEGQLEVIIGKAGAVAGRVIDSRQQPVVNVTVAAVPEASLRSRPDLYKKARTDGSGRFRLFGLAPGDYKLFAWEQIEEGLWADTDFLRPFESRGKPVRVSESRTENVDVTVIAR